MAYLDYDKSVKSEAVGRLARECGFELAGVAPALPLADANHFLQWVQNGMAGRMGYLTDHRAQLRTDPRLLLPSAKSIICVGKLYNRPEPYAYGLPGSGKANIARYAGGEDYHDVLRRGLEKLRNRLEAEFGVFESKICVDTAPLLERSYAHAAGLGWIGKNTCLIHEGAGSWFFLGELLVSLELEPDAPPADRCGTCTRCIDACPTDALVPGGERFQVDANRCISYFTIELKGDIPADVRTALGAHVFGCDICQDVCPWNGKASVTGEAAFLSGNLTPDLTGLAGLTEQQFRSDYRNSPVWRARYTGFLRNVAVAMGNSRDPAHRPALLNLAENTDPVVASHAAWALQQFE